MAGQAGRAGRRAVAIQRLQDPADAEPRQARDRRSRGGHMDVIEWATDPWGQTVPIHIAWVLIWVAAIAGLAFLVVHAIFVRYFAQAEEFAGAGPPELAGAVCRSGPQALAGRAPLSLDDGGLDAHAVVHGVSAQGGGRVRLGDLPLDRRRGVDGVGHLSCVPCLLLARLLGDLAGQNRSSGRMAGGRGGSSGCRRRRRDDSPSIRWRTRGTTSPSSSTGLSVIGTGVFMLFRVRTIFFTAQSVPVQRHDLGADVRAARAGRCRTDRVGHGSRLLRDPTGEAGNHEVDDRRFDEA